MYLALLGFGMIVVFMALIMAKKLSPFTSLILIPIVFGLLAGYGWDTLEYAANGASCSPRACSTPWWMLWSPGVRATP